jgi:flavin-dependent dehydrogenase
MYDLAVIGAGPAGCSAAITAARQGARVVLFEKGDFPRQKVCGEFVSAESLALLSSLLSVAQRPLLENALRICAAQIFLDGRTIRTKIEPAAASIP